MKIIAGNIHEAWIAASRGIIGPFVCRAREHTWVDEDIVIGFGTCYAVSFAVIGHQERELIAYAGFIEYVVIEVGVRNLDESSANKIGEYVISECPVIYVAYIRKSTIRAIISSYLR